MACFGKYVLVINLLFYNGSFLNLAVGSITENLSYAGVVAEETQ